MGCMIIICCITTCRDAHNGLYNYHARHQPEEHRHRRRVRALALLARPARSVYITLISYMNTCRRSKEERRWLFEEPTQSRVSPSILQYTKIMGYIITTQDNNQKSIVFVAAPGRLLLSPVLRRRLRVWLPAEDGIAVVVAL